MVQDIEVLHAQEGNVARNYNATLPIAQEQKVLQATLLTNYRTGSSASAVYGKLDLKTTGSANGMAQAGTFEVISSSDSLSRGQLNCIDLEFGGAGATNSAGPLAFIRMGAWGAGAIAAFNGTTGTGYILDIQGLTSTANGAYDATQSPANTNASIKIRVGATDYWIPMSTTAS